MGWEEELVNLDSNIWNKLHVQKYLNETLGEGKWEKIDYRGKYRWSNSEIVIEILLPTIRKQGQIKIIRNGESEIKSTYDMKEIKEMI
tara:strand:- start:772 stop:1035 length:264 start_codon:yes stop_codon:yes gene_type:complete